MTKLTTKSLESISSKMEGIDKSSVRYRILQSAKNFKTSWMDLGQSLYAAWKDKLYKEWGYMTFEAYTGKEIGIKKATAMKLLKSYYFLEKEEPIYLQKENSDPVNASSVPSYESVNLLRLAKDKKKLDGVDYAALKKDVFAHGKDASEVRRSLTSIIKQREEMDPDEARIQKRLSTLKRSLATLKALKRDLEISKMLPAAVIKDISSIIVKIESEIS
ncbi:MAG: hypothetical protein NTY76_03970 [Candidatus Omnitrophica bacterium]|nr:hypothetical protein [Candidatus Omnitrophota bacterium]